MKRFTGIMLALLLTAGVLWTPALAAGEDYIFTLKADGEARALTEVGDTVTVSFHITSTGAEIFQLYGMQDYINFDPEYLEYVPGSEKFFEIGGYPVISGSALPGGRQVLTNRAGFDPITVRNGDMIMSFQLRALKAGKVSVTSSGAEMISGEAELFTTALENAWIDIRPPHVHTLEHVAEKPAAENETGVKAHWKCTGCGRLFLDEKGTEEASETDLLIPVKQHVHSLVRIPGREPAESVPGLREHWMCTGCKKLFADDKGTKEISRGDTVIPKLPSKPSEPVAPPIAPPPIAPVPSGFEDVQKGAWYEEAVNWAVDNDITQGTAHNRFSPNANCTRAQAVTFLWRAAGKPAPSAAACPFADVPSDAYYRSAVMWAMEKGITQGTSDRTFSPEDTCTRGQIVTFLWRSKGSESSEGAIPFEDVAQTDWYAQAVTWAVNHGVTQGVSSSRFAPSDFCTRGQIVTFMYRSR